MHSWRALRWLAHEPDTMTTRTLRTSTMKGGATTVSATWPHRSDPENIDEVFVDGEHEYAIRVAPAAYPTFFLFGSGRAGTLGLIFTLAYGVIATWRDKRWKVVVVRAALKKPALWHTIDVEFVKADDAERRQVEILRSWDGRQRAEHAVIRLKDVRRLRLDSLPQP